MFNEKINSLKERLERVDKMQADEKRSQTLNHLAEKIKAVEQSIESKASHFQFFIENNLIEKNMSLDIVKKERLYENLNKIKGNFGENPVPDSITKDNHFKLLEEGCEKVNKFIEDLLIQSWDKFKSKAYSGEKYRQLQERVPSSPGNVENLRRFYQKETEFEREVSSPVYDINGINKIIAIGNELKSIFNSLETDLPTEVEDFFAAIYEGGASIDLFTEEVKRYLQDKNMLHQYKIVANNT